MRTTSKRWITSRSKGGQGEGKSDFLSIVFFLGLFKKNQGFCGFQSPPWQVLNWEICHGSQAPMAE